MNIFKQELKMMFRSLISYTIGMLIMFYFFLFFFDSFSSNTRVLDELLSNFPKEFRAAFGFSDVKMSELSGYLSFLYGYIVLIGAIFGMKLGISVLSEETRVKTADFLISKPVKRYQIAAEKLAAVLVCIVLQNILMLAIAMPGALSKADDKLSAGVFTLFSLTILMVQLFFVGTGMFLSVLFRRIKAVMPITLAVVFMFYIIELINQSLLEEKLTYLTPFSYFKGAYIIEHSSYQLKYVAVDIAVFIIFTLLGCFIYQKKDVHSV